MPDRHSTQKTFTWHRWVSVLLRSVHICAAGVLLGGVFIGASYDVLAIAIWGTLVSGGAMMLLDLIKSPRFLLQGSGIAVLLKLVLLAVGFYVFPEQRFVWYLAATFVASVGSHMPSVWRHFDCSN